MLDEPTAALGVAQTAQVLDLIERLRERGLGVVVISHNLADVFAVADRIVVLRLGRNAGDVQRRRDRRREEIVAAITGATRQRRDAASRATEKAAARGGDGGAMTPSGDRRHAPARSTPTTCGARDGRRPDRVAGSRTLRPSRQGGELGSLPVVIGLIVIWSSSSSSNDRFLSAENLTNLMLQIAATGTISVGIVLVLLLGEIDLSVGSVSGVRAAVMAVLNVDARLVGRRRDRRRRSLAGAGDRRCPGLFFTTVRRAVVRRHARRPDRLAGRCCLRAGRHRHDQPPVRRRHRRARQHLLLAGASATLIAVGDRRRLRRVSRCVGDAARRPAAGARGARVRSSIVGARGRCSGRAVVRRRRARTGPRACRWRC